MDMKDIEQRAKLISSETRGLLGPVPLERVVRKHVDFFKELRNAGASWRQIAALMTKAGIYRKDDQPIGHDQWRSMVARANRMSKETQEPARQAVPSPRRSRPEPALSYSSKSTTQSEPVGATDGSQNNHRNRRAIRERMRNARAVRDD